METIVYKIKITPELIGKDCLVFEDLKQYNYIDYAVPSAVTIKKISRRSLEQLGLLWKCAAIAAEQLQDDSNFNTSEKIMKQAKLAIKYYDPESVIYYKDKNGNERVYFDLGSIAFDNLEQAEANGIIDDLMIAIANFFGIEKDDLVREAKLRMEHKYICEKCGGRATETHHKYSKTKESKRLYREYIDRPENLQRLCYDCHHNKTLDKLTEKEFCELFGIDVRSKGLNQLVIQKIKSIKPELF